jgi:hypothetical protein
LTPNPRFGAFVEMGLPSWPMILAVLPIPDTSIIDPAAARTPGSARMRGRRAAGTVGAPLAASATIGRPVTTASVFL